MATTLRHSPELKRRNLCTACILMVIAVGFAASVIYVRYGKAPMLPPSNSNWQSMAQPADAAIAAPNPLMPVDAPAPASPPAATEGSPDVR